MSRITTKIGNKSINLCTRCETIANFGSNVIYGPSKQVKKLMSAFGATISGSSGVYVIDCSKVKSLPKIVFRVSNVDLPIYPSDYVINDSGDCFLKIVEDTYPEWTLGAPFLSRYYSIYDYERAYVGLAKAK